MRITEGSGNQTNELLALAVLAATLSLHFYTVCRVYSVVGSSSTKQVAISCQIWKPIAECIRTLISDIPEVCELLALASCHSSATFLHKCAHEMLNI